MPAVEVLVPAGEAFDLAGEALRDRLAALYRLPGERWVRVNLVASLTGALAGPSGTSEDLTGGIDRTVLGVLRRSADVVLVGAGTLRVERLTHPRTAALAVASIAGALDRGDVPTDPDSRRALVLCPSAVAEVQAARLGGSAEVVAVPGDPREQPALLIAALAERGLHRVVCEGGAGLAGALLSAGLADELDLTTAPLAAGGAGPVLRARLPGATLAGLLRDGTDRLYARWQPAPR